MSSVVKTFLVLAVLSMVYAAPLADTRSSFALRPRQSSSDPSQPGPPQQGSLSVQIWAPLVAIVGVILGLIVISCYRRRRAANATTSQTATATQLTAAQLTGTNATTTATTHRPRRNRRTPSQISTRSLPAYMEDPGDSEMVLARGIEDMQDPMPTLAEDRENPSSLSQSDLHNVSAPNLNLSFNASTTSQTPLLHLDSHGQDQNQDRGHAQPHPGEDLRLPESSEDPNTARASVAYPPQSLLRTTSNSSSHVRSSIDTVRTLGSGSEESQRGLLGVGWELRAVYGDRREGTSDEGRGRESEVEGTSGGGSASRNTERNEGSTISAEELQARGEAPPYFEVVDRQSEGVMEMTAMRPDGPTGGQVESGTIGTGQTREPRRRSGFRSFAARISQLMPSGSSQSTATPPLPSSTIPLLPPPGASTNAGQGTIRAASSRTPSAQEPSPPLATAPAGTTDHTRHRSATSGSGSTTFSAAISIAASAISPSSTPGASLASPSTASLPPMSRSRSRLASLLSGNTSQATIPRPGSSFTTSNQNLSTASLSSTLISPPLPHTLIRTNFVYPNAGPTTEQMRFISSRESIARFGIPYGRAAEEAVRMDMPVEGEEPPPFDWEGEGGGEETGGRGVVDENRGGAGEDAATAERETGENGTGGEVTADIRMPNSTAPFVVLKHTPRPGVERQASQSSSTGTFETAPEENGNVTGEHDGPAGAESKEPEWDFEEEAGGDSIPNSGTAIPQNSTLPNINIITNLGSSSPPSNVSQEMVATSAVDAAKFVPTPPPTPPTAVGPGLGSGNGGTRNGSQTQLVPRIEVAPASPA